jgi:hypothetical protein
MDVSSVSAQKIDDSRANKTNEANKAKERREDQRADETAKEKAAARNATNKEGVGNNVDTRV